ncbi:MAG: hypothetical protein ACYCZA_00470, partial [Thiobacillus sp.]
DDNGAEPNNIWHLGGAVEGVALPPHPDFADLPPGKVRVSSYANGETSFPIAGRRTLGCHDRRDRTAAGQGEGAASAGPVRAV